MSTYSLVYVGYTDPASHHTQSLASAIWVIYTLAGQVLSSGFLCIWPSSNNIVEYSVVIELLRDAISHGIQSLELRLDSQLVVLQLNGMHRIRDLTLL